MRIRSPDDEATHDIRLKLPMEPVTPLALVRGGFGSDAGCAGVAPGLATAQPGR